MFATGIGAPLAAHQDAEIAGLPARIGVKDRAVEHDSLLIHRDDARLAFAQIAVVAEQAFGRHKSLS